MAWLPYAFSSPLLVMTDNNYILVPIGTSTRAQTLYQKQN